MAKIINYKTGMTVGDYPNTSLADAVISYFNENGVIWIRYQDAARFLASAWENESYFNNVSVSNFLELFPNLGKATSKDEILALLQSSSVFVGVQNSNNSALWNQILNTTYPDLTVTKD